MGARIGGFLFCMVFAVPFGGVGGFATYGAGKMAIDSHRAGGWVLVQAKVDEAALNASQRKRSHTSYASAAYRYTVAGKEYVGTRLGFTPWDGSDNIGDWQEEMAGFMEDAKASGKLVPVFVNPDNPEDSVVDRDIRWPMMAFMGVFALIFGSVGLVALISGGSILFGKESKKKRAERESIEAYVAKHNRASVGGGASSVLDELESDETVAANEAMIHGAGLGSVVGRWIATLIWNLIAWPATLMAWPTIVAGEWLAAFVFLFPLVGVLILWGSVSSTIALIRRGRAVLRLETLEPRMGTHLAGTVTFSSAGKVGELFDVELAAIAASETNAHESARATLWSANRSVRLADSPQGGSRLPFRIDIPARVARGEKGIDWRLRLKGPGDSTPFESFEIHVGPSREPAGAFLEPEAESPDIARNTQAMAKLFGAEVAAKMPVPQQAAFADLSPGTQQAVATLVKNRGTIKKVLIGVVVLVVAWQLIGVVLVLVQTFRN